ncbi:MAG: hypothetical protein KKE53_04875 [Proteobacteria bacterium]|nr:hypothetical protein [Pseudomonadota bacterium]
MNANYSSMLRFIFHFFDKASHFHFNDYSRERIPLAINLSFFLAMFSPMTRMKRSVVLDCHITVQHVADGQWIICSRAVCTGNPETEPLAMEKWPQIFGG